VDGLPLAIELAAARARVLSLPQIADRLTGHDQGLGLLNAGTRAAAPRHQSLRATLDWSYQLLSEDERAAFRRLAVFTSGFTLEAAEAVCGRGVLERVPALRAASDGVSTDVSSESQHSITPPLHHSVLDLLSHLVDKSLVAAEEPGEEGRRYRLLEPIRQYGLEQLVQSGEETPARDRHAGYFLRLAAEGRSRFGGLGSFRVLEPEFPNVRAALDFSRTRPGLAELAIDAASELYSFWTIRGDHREARRWWESALSAPDWLPPARRARALRVLGLLALYRSDVHAAAPLLHEAASAERAVGDASELAWTLLGLAALGRYSADPDLTRCCSDIGLRLARRFDNHRCAAGHLLQRGWLHYSEGATSEAGDCAQKALSLLRAFDDPVETMEGLHLAGATCSGQPGRLADARARLLECLQLCRAMGDRMMIAKVLSDLGGLARQEGDLSAARALFEESLAMRRGLGDPVGTAGSLSEQAFGAIESGRLDDAGALLAESLAIRREIDDEVGVARMLLHLGTMARHQGDLRGARSRYAESLTILQKRDQPWMVAFVLLSLALLELQEDGHEPARTWMEEALAIWRDAADPRGIDRSLHAIPQCAGATAASPGSRSAVSVRRAAKLFGAAQALLEKCAPALDEGRREEWKRALGVVARTLGEAEFRAAEAEGRALHLTPEILVDLAASDAQPGEGGAGLGSRPQRRPAQDGAAAQSC
jgi:tetratricopeptide (TPR) repeat protein